MTRLHMSLGRHRVNGRSAVFARHDNGDNGLRDVATVRKRIGILLFDQVAATDLMGPAETFCQSTISANNGSDVSCYRVVTIGINTKPCRTESGIMVRPKVDIRHAPVLDTVIVPGGSGIHELKLKWEIVKWLSHRAADTRRIAALGTGLYALAATGLLDGRHVVTHWRLAKDVALQFPSLRVNSSNLFAKDGAFYTCAGGISAVDLSLALIEEDYGRQVALGLARELVLHLKRPASHEQYSEQLKFQTQSSDRFADLPAWILSHLSHDLSVEALAHRAGMSRRNFTRLFLKAFGKTPGEFVAAARIAEARRRLLVPRNSVESVGASLGFRSADVFSVTFERYTGVRPCTYRKRFRASVTKFSAN